MRIGFLNPKTDLSKKHIAFIADNEKHFITFHLSLLKGIYDVCFDDQEAKIIDAYPPLIKLVRECTSIILHDLHVIVKKIVHKKKNHIPSN